jgi:ParB family chromosome partitioning protein
MPDLHLIPLDTIAADALIRDRASLDVEALFELQTSIAVSGLRMPVEVFELAEPDGPRRYGLISGYRRLAAFRALAGTAVDPARYAAIPAFLRAPQSVAEALTAMVEENAIRTEVSPWEQALIAVIARDNGVFDTLEAAIDALYAALSRDKRYRMRSIAHLAEELDGHLAAPETLSLRRLLRLAAATSRGYAGLMRHALTEAKLREPNAQWRVLAPILAECEDATIPDPRPERGHRDRPRRTYVTPRHALRIRREMTRGGWCLHFTGRDASGELIDRVFDEIEMLFSPG